MSDLSVPGQPGIGGVGLSAPGVAASGLGGLHVTENGISDTSGSFIADSSGNIIQGTS